MRLELLAADDFHPTASEQETLDGRTMPVFPYIPDADQEESSASFWLHPRFIEIFAGFLI